MVSAVGNSPSVLALSQAQSQSNSDWRDGVCVRRSCCRGLDWPSIRCPIILRLSILLRSRLSSRAGLAIRLGAKLRALANPEFGSVVRLHTSILEVDCDEISWVAGSYEKNCQHLSVDRANGAGAAVGPSVRYLLALSASELSNDGLDFAHVGFFAF